LLILLALKSSGQIQISLNYGLPIQAVSDRSPLRVPPVVVGGFQPNHNAVGTTWGFKTYPHKVNFTLSD
jgi:hypothetical protein